MAEDCVEEAAIGGIVIDDQHGQVTYLLLIRQCWLAP